MANHRNQPCSCGSGRKHKHCCGRAGTYIGSMLHYCRATKAHYRSLSAQPVDQMFNSMDLIHAGPSFDEYRIVVSEIEKAPIPVHVMPLLFHDKMRSLFEMEDDSVELEVWSTRMQAICQDGLSRLKFVNTRLDTIDGLWRELQREPKSFAVTCPEFPTSFLNPVVMRSNLRAVGRVRS